ncbi:hypothetical protein H6G97_31405 [Nostoc flagelliforme FACHB-838]|uniref:Uncharacterized protein n=1 Tax=Nostoc flagelliforme FACHB-838 TaxID=2692904 RepID=A0ABR8DY78_9NOSO|nr:hypothetical protein [Nostoc flagelliforme]MBD2533816.1 hypothetical protein [Nostoc flagelliforme FACHB-838]
MTAAPDIAIVKPLGEVYLGVKVAKTHFAAMRHLKIILRLCFRKKN